jgi:hypothetical protein
MQPNHSDTLDGYLSKYDNTARLNRRGWAYEHLRRNPVFCQQAWSTSADAVSVKAACYQISVMKLRRPQPGAEAWGLIFFPNPDQSALEADVFWSDDVYPNHIRLHIARRLPGEVDEIFMRTVEHCRVRHLTDWNGNEHMLIRGKACTVQARCVGLSLLANEPVKMSYDLRGPEPMEKRFRMYKTAESVWDDPYPLTVKWTPEAERLRNGLICLDVKDAGLDLRHAAEIIYGVDRVEEDWAVCQAFRDRMRAFYKRAVALRDGGYRALLQKKV